MPRKFALLIGVSEYGEGFEPLSAPPNDVAAVQRVLQNPDLGGFDPAHIKTLINPGPIEMQRDILALFSQSLKDDLILLFFSGHGITNDDNHLYFCTRQTSKADYLATAVPARFIQGLSNNLNYAKRQVMILDCCYSGAFAEGWRRKGDIKVELERELGKEGRVVLTSSSATQVSFQQEESALSLYTQYLVEGIETGAADTDRDGEVKVRELHDYAKRKVQEAKPKMKPDIIVADDQGYDVLLSRVRINRELRFRQAVEECVDHEQGDILDIDLETIQVRAQRLGLSSDQAQSIVDSVLEPFRRRKRNLQRYQEKYVEFVQRQYPLTARTVERLQIWQQEVLGLEDMDVVPIQRAINEKKEQELQNARLAAQLAAKPKPTPPTPQKLSTAVPQQNVDTANRTDSKRQQKSFLDTFSFETIKITGIQKTGGIFGFGQQVDCIIQRKRLTTQYFAEQFNIAMVLVPSGTFDMGQTEEERQELIRQVGEANYQKWYARECPRHRVSIPSFFMSKVPITQAQYQAVMGDNPATTCESKFVAPDKPVVGVSWNDAIAFCQKLSQLTQKQYRLPSESEWEYACRAGTTTPFYFGETIITDQANYRGTDFEYEGKIYPGNYGNGPKGLFREETTPVGAFPANAFGLYDMHGNVFEWCQDCWHENYNDAPTDGKAWEVNGVNTYRLLRGGSWYDYPLVCRSADRYRGVADDRDYVVGFRVVCSPPRTPGF